MSLESIVIKILGTKHPVSKTLSKAAVGCFPARIQKNLASKSNLNALKFTYYSIGVGLTLTAIKYTLGDLIDHIPVVEYVGKAGKGLGIYGLVNETVRSGYTLLTQQPIGALILEIPDRVIHSEILTNTYIRLTNWFYGI